MSARARGVMFIQHLSQAILGTYFAMGQNLLAHWHAVTLGAQPFPTQQAPQTHGGVKAATLEPGAETPLQQGQLPSGDSDPTKPPSPATCPRSLCRQPFSRHRSTSTHTELFVAGADVDLDQVEDNKAIFRFIPQPVKGNRLCWLRQALPNLSGHGWAPGRVTPMVGTEEGWSSDAPRTQWMQ